MYFNKIHMDRVNVRSNVKNIKERLINFPIKNYNKQVKINLHGKIENKKDLIVSIETAKEFLSVNKNGKIILNSFFKSHKKKDRVEALKKINIFLLSKLYRILECIYDRASNYAIWLGHYCFLYWLDRTLF